jgi:hypothetical protein
LARADRAGAFPVVTDENFLPSLSPLYNPPTAISAFIPSPDLSSMMSVTSSSSFDTESITVPMEMYALRVGVFTQPITAYMRIDTDDSLSQTFFFFSPDAIEEVGCIRA